MTLNSGSSNVVKIAQSFAFGRKISMDFHGIPWRYFTRGTRPSLVLIEVFARQKNLKRATGHLFLQRTTQAAWNPCCDDGKLVSLFIQCLTSVAVMICMWLFFFFFFPRSLFWVASLVPLAHFPRFCWHYFSLSTKFLIHLAKKTYFLLCSGFWNTF